MKVENSSHDRKVGLHDIWNQKTTYQSTSRATFRLLKRTLSSPFTEKLRFALRRLLVPLSSPHPTLSPPSLTLKRASVSYFSENSRSAFKAEISDLFFKAVMVNKWFTYAFQTTYDIDNLRNIKWFTYAFKTTYDIDN